MMLGHGLSSPTPQHVICGRCGDVLAAHVTALVSWEFLGDGTVWIDGILTHHCDPTVDSRALMVLMPSDTVTAMEQSIP